MQQFLYNPFFKTNIFGKFQTLFHLFTVIRLASSKMFLSTSIKLQETILQENKRQIKLPHKYFILQILNMLTSYILTSIAAICNMHLDMARINLNKRNWPIKCFRQDPFLLIVHVAKLF